MSLSPELKQQYDALVAATGVIQTADAGGRDVAIESFVSAWNDLPEGLRRYIKFQTAWDDFSINNCMNLFSGRNIDPENPNRTETNFFEYWEVNAKDPQRLNYHSRVYADPKDDKSLLKSWKTRMEERNARRMGSNAQVDRP